MSEGDQQSDVADNHHDLIVVGAGIAGLVAALSLAKFGRKVLVLESAPRPSEVGAGIQVPPNACHVLQQLGLLEKVTEKAVRPKSICLADALSGQVVLELPVDDIVSGAGDLPFLTVHRAALHGVLYEAAENHPQIELLAGHRVVRVSENNALVNLTIDSPNGLTQLTAGLVVGADGVWSKMRQAIMGAALPRATGRVAMRAVVPSDFDNRADKVVAWMAPDSHLVTYPIRNSATRNLVAIVRGKIEEETDWSGDVERESLASLFSNLKKTPCGALLQDAEWKRWPLFSVDATGTWHGKRIVLIGDAAHCIEPFAAQGAAMAIEDGYELADTVHHHTGDMWEEAFVSYRKRRLDRIVKVSERTNFNRFVYHQSGVGRMMRNAAFSLRPQRSFASDLDWLYGYRSQES